MTWKEGADQRIANYISSEIEEPVFVGAFIVVAEAIDSDGDQCVMVNAAPDQRMTATFGLLTYAMEVERAALARLEDDE